jgi:hypothetical protein
MDNLSSVPIEQLLAELQSRATHGVLSLVRDEEIRERTACWWGDLDLCVGLSTQLGHEVMQEIDAAGQEQPMPAPVPRPPSESVLYGLYL